MLFQFPGASQQGGDVLPDHLGEDGFPGRILIDAAQDVGFQTRVLVNPEIFRDVDVGPPESFHNPHERQVSHVLHGREEEQGPMFW